ncbi:DNA (cytosine-5-)-methyltransferase [Mixta mediterraneensis]|uniref:DNA (cytosine-5-)-methyltransferase n=1 Tax=Mixta mediterraneensis TaxID=2758443 RepID=UPI0018773DE2|nr:DNA (cytosine-5-)-methyltransferase [Mixta mediterraneensis]MBE5251404.1 DNA (cytosine-5-)-methyltransferase [Mixta mediterraneensis]
MHADDAAAIADPLLSPVPHADESALLTQVLAIYSVRDLVARLHHAGYQDWTPPQLNRIRQGKTALPSLSAGEMALFHSLLPTRPAHYTAPAFRFIDLFAGIGGIRRGFDAIGGKCVFTSEWNKEAVRTYRANHYSDPLEHTFNSDIRQITQPADLSGDEAIYRYIDAAIPDHQVLLAGFPCQPFSLAGVSKKNALGRAHGFECQVQGTLFFDVARILAAKKPPFFVLENVKNLKSHDKGRTFAIIMETLDALGYDVADAEADAPDVKIIDARHFLPQHRERIVLVGIRRDIAGSKTFTLRDIRQHFPSQVPSLQSLLETQPDEKYILSPQLWRYLYEYAKKHKAKGNGFGFGLNDPRNLHGCVRTLSARYYKDGSEILIDRGWDSVIGEADFHDAANMARRPRRLSPRECARLMGFDVPGSEPFRIPVSDTQAYKQFGNSVVVPVFAAVAQLLLPYIRNLKR